MAGRRPGQRPDPRSDREDPGYEVVPRPAQAPADRTFESPPSPPPGREGISPIEVLLVVTILLVVAAGAWWFVAGPGRGALFPSMAAPAPTAAAGAPLAPTPPLAPRP